MANGKRRLPNVRETMDEQVQGEQQVNIPELGRIFETQKGILEKIALSLKDISINVSNIAGFLPNLLDVQRSLEETKSKPVDTLKDEEQKREERTFALKEAAGGVIKDSAAGVFGFFEKLFAFLTPFFLGLALAFTDLTNPAKLLKDAFLAVIAFMTGKFIYQLAKSVTLAALIAPDPKVINAPGSVINAGGLGTGGADDVIVGPDGEQRDKRKDKRKKPSRGPEGKRTGRGTRIGKVIAGAGALETIAGAGQDTTTPTGTTPRRTGGAGGMLGKLRGMSGFAKFNAITLVASTALGAASDYSSKKEEGKSSLRAGTETAAGAAGTLGGGFAGLKAGAALGTLITPGAGTAIGGLIGMGLGAYFGEKVLSGITEKVFNFFAGDVTNKRKEISLFSKEYREMTPQERAKATIKEVANPTPQSLAILQKEAGIIPLTKFTNEELLRANKDIITAKERKPEYAQSTNFNIARGGDMNQQMIVNNGAIHAEMSRRGLGTKPK